MLLNGIILAALEFALVWVIYRIAYINGYVDGTRNGIVTISRYYQEIGGELLRMKPFDQATKDAIREAKNVR